MDFLVLKSLHESLQGGYEGVGLLDGKVLRHGLSWPIGKGFV